jgi:cellulose biosynthesis protein BcsQ
MTVEIVGPAGSRWLSLPAAAPIAELLPALGRLVGGEAPVDDPDWVLAPPVGRPLEAGASLRESGVRPGSVLCLVGSGLAADADGVAPPHALVGMRTPLRRTAAVLPRRLRAWERLRATYRLARPRADGQPFASEQAMPPWGGAAVHPATFTQVRPGPLWRRALKAWRGLDHLGRLETVIAAPRLRRGVRVVVIAYSPGAGGTVVASLLGMLMAHLRRDLVVAVDGRAGAGSLSALVAASTGGHPDDLPLLSRGAEATPTQLDASLGRGRHGLRVLSAPAVDEPAYHVAFDRLRRLAGVLVVDCGPGLDAPAARAAIGSADQVLIVAEAEPEASPELGRLVGSLRRDDRSVLVVANAPRHRVDASDVRRLAVMAAGADGLIEMPWCPAGAAQLAAGELDWERAPGPWLRSGHELAAAVAADWRRLGLSTS